MRPHAVAIPPDVDDVTVMHEPVDERAGHDVVPEDLAPLLEALVAGEHGGCSLVAAAHQVKEEHRPGAADREVANLVDDEERGEDERLEPLAEPASGLGFLEGRDQVGERAVVDAAPALRTGDREADGEVGFPDPRRPEEDYVLLPLDEAQSVEAVDLLPHEGMGLQPFANMLLQEWIAHHKRLKPSQVKAGLTNLDDATLG